MKRKAYLPTVHLISWKRSLLAVPARNESAEVKEERGGGLRISVFRKNPRWLFPPLSWIISARPRISMLLDKKGAEVWKLCDSKNSVENLVDYFAERFGLRFHEARAAVIGYLSVLVHRGALAMVEYKQKGLS